MLYLLVIPIKNKVRRILILLLLLQACNGHVPAAGQTTAADSKMESPEIESPFLIVLGTVQDAGSPQLGCTKACCASLTTAEMDQRKVVAAGLVDAEYDRNFLFEATPDIKDQVSRLQGAGNSIRKVPDGIFLTHAHIGHYTGLMYLGKESANTDSVPVYTMPRMQRFLERNGPWDQLLSQGNITLQGLEEGEVMRLTPNISVQSLRVPHRDEYSETVGFLIRGPDRKALFIPDIDKWERWEQSIIKLLSTVDYALIDATFYDGAEVPDRNMSEIPHPFVVESMELFKELPGKEKEKIYFIHMNHTNPILDSLSVEYREVIEHGYRVARIGQRLPL